MNSITPPASQMPALHTGDVIACWGTDRVSRVISLMTSSVLPPWWFAWAPSHVAMVHREPGFGPVWYESTTMAVPRDSAGHKGGAQLHDPEERWNAYGGRCVVLRPQQALSSDQKERIGIELRHSVNQRVQYDLPGAILSGTRLVRLLVPASRGRMFCSELVADVLQRADLKNWASPASYSPGRLCRELVKSGAYEVVRRKD